MERLRKALATIAKALSRLDTTQRLLIGSLVVIAGMALFLVAQYAGRASWSEVLPGSTLSEQQAAQIVLANAGIDAQLTDKLTVPSGDRQRAQAVLAQSGAMPADAALMFRNIIEKQSWQFSRQQNDRLYAIALQNELAGVISNFRGIKSATVIIDSPDSAGFGRTMIKPTASATVFSKSGQPIDQGTVDAVAQLIAGARAGLLVENVRVIDGSSGRQRKASSEEDVSSSTYIDHATKMEGSLQSKLMELLAYIPGRIVAVTAQVDVTRSNSTVTKYLEKGEGTTSLIKTTKESTTTSSQAAQGGAEPGVRSNQAADINRGSGGSGNKSEQTEENREMDNRVGSTTEHTVNPKGNPTMVAVSVGVPSAYVVDLMKKEAAKAGAAQGGAAAPPTPEPSEQEIQAKFDKDIKPKLEESILPHVRAMSVDIAKGADAAQVAELLKSQVAISLIPMDLTPITGGGSGGLMGTSGGFLAMGGGLIEKAVLGLLAAVALGLMFMMTRRTAKKIEMPTAEEIVGLPPTLEAKSDLIGEAEEGDSPMAGIELDESEVAAQKMLDQVKELAKSSPDSAASMIKRWVTVEN
ncbi:MAG: hypothetical protein IT432_02895 [Phycisphaerales bacterium]|nr:hypothetical protein [Phycisphaerales bacterium]